MKENTKEIARICIFFPLEGERKLNYTMRFPLESERAMKILRNYSLHWYIADPLLLQIDRCSGDDEARCEATPSS